MGQISSGDRVFYGVIFLAALLVAVIGLFMPAQLAAVLPWAQVPPLHARFIGAMYGFGAVFMLFCMLSSRFAAVRWAHLMIALWTGLLLVISLFHLEVFRLNRTADQIWFASYIIYPLIGLFLAWRQQPWANPDHNAPNALPDWAKNLLLIQGAILTLLALALLLASTPMSQVWPWPVSPLLAQIYAGPLLSLGLGSLLFGRQASWLNTLPLVAGLLTFTAGTLIASLIHSRLFSLAQLSDGLWFTFFGLATLGNLVLLALILARNNAGTRVARV